MKKLKPKININDIEYVLVCDYYVPNFHFFEGINIGYYGNKRLKYLVEYNHQEFVRLKEQNVLTDYLLIVNESVITKKYELTAALAEQNLGEVNDAEVEWRIMKEKYLEIELTVLSQFVYV